MLVGYQGEEIKKKKERDLTLISQVTWGTETIPNSIYGEEDGWLRNMNYKRMKVVMLKKKLPVITSVNEFLGRLYFWKIENL